MKLYTEEQVKKAIGAGVQVGYSNQFNIDNIVEECYRVFEHITPIELELPSDDDIEVYRNRPLNNEWCQYGIMVGAKWMREQILSKEDKTFKQKSKSTPVEKKKSI